MSWEDTMTIYYQCGLLSVDIIHTRSKCYNWPYIIIWDVSAAFIFSCMFHNAWKCMRWTSRVPPCHIRANEFFCRVTEYWSQLMAVSVSLNWQQLSLFLWHTDTFFKSVSMFFCLLGGVIFLCSFCRCTVVSTYNIYIKFISVCKTRKRSLTLHPSVCKMNTYLWLY